MSYIEELGMKAKAAWAEFTSADVMVKNNALLKIAELLIENQEKIIEENKIDLINAEKSGKSASFIERLTLNEKRIKDISDGVREVVALPDPVGEVIGGGDLKNGLSIVKKRVPLGVIGIIYESRPNVTADAAALCIKSGNACILRGGSDAINSSRCLVEIMRKAISDTGLSPDIVQLVEDTSREVATELMRLNKYVDVLIPRGGAGLIQSVVQNATVPVIETGAGNCHIYIDEFADIDMAVAITDNAKTSRPSVCNSIETMLINKKIAPEFLKKLGERWGERVKIYGDEETAKYIKIERAVTELDYETEYNDYVIASKVVCDIEEAIKHINNYSTKHSDCIITENLKNARRFEQGIDSAAVYVNASTRFTDGNEFGLGAEIGISNQKLHARGPMGLTELTTYKYIINGNGQVRG